MFERLTDRLQDTFKNLAGRGKLTEANIGDAMREVRRALLEADVNYQVAKNFVKNVRQECLGEKVLKSIAPGQQAIKVVNDQLTALLGDSNAPLELAGKPAVVMLVGLHGSGKTTTSAKLAMYLRDKMERKPMMVGADLMRPAAIHQLQVLGEELEIPVYSDETNKNVVEVVLHARRQAQEQGRDVLIVDTAGRLEVDTDLVQELIDLKRSCQPQEILLVADAALGQQAVSVAQHFDEALGITGIILTKLDGDARGGAALSMREVTGQPIKFAGVGEKLQDLNPFYPDRMASRILGMGDVVGLVERAAENIKEDEAQALEEKLRQNRFDFDDFLGQLRRIRKMGGIMSLMDMLPGMGQIKKMGALDEGQFNRVEGIICSMTAKERQYPHTIDLSRRRRIAKGSGVDMPQVNQLLKQFEMMRKMMGKMGKMMGKMPAMPEGAGLEDLQGMMGGGMPGMSGGMPSLGGMNTMPGFGSGRGERSAKPKKRKKNKKRR
jgi:signal recognition particle subunit SRP54